MTVRNGMLFVSMLHSDKVEIFRINQPPLILRQSCRHLGFESTGGITPEGLEVSPDGRTVYVANLQTEDVSFLGVDANGNLTRQGYLAVGVTLATPDPVRVAMAPALFATDEEVGLRWLLSSAYVDDPPWLASLRADLMRENRATFVIGMEDKMAANGMSRRTQSGGVKLCPQNKISLTTGRSGTRD